MDSAAACICFNFCAVQGQLFRSYAVQAAAKAENVLSAQKAVSARHYHMYIFRQTAGNSADKIYRGNVAKQMKIVDKNVVRAPAAKGTAKFVGEKPLAFFVRRA